MLSKTCPAAVAHICVKSVLRLLQCSRTYILNGHHDDALFLVRLCTTTRLRTCDFVSWSEVEDEIEHLQKRCRQVAMVKTLDSATASSKQIPHAPPAFSGSGGSKSSCILALSFTSFKQVNSSVSVRWISCQPRRIRLTPALRILTSTMHPTVATSPKLIHC